MYCSLMIHDHACTCNQSTCTYYFLVYGILYALLCLLIIVFMNLCVHMKLFLFFPMKNR